VHFADPLGEAERPGPEHLPVVDLLERLAVALAARDLADEEIIGVESWNAVCTPIAALLAPGPRVTKHRPGRPVSLPCASAM
jgi:hypothetical protein